MANLLLLSPALCRRGDQPCGVAFSGHTEFSAEQSKTSLVVMMLATDCLRTALVTTHLPLAEVPQAITCERLEQIVHILHKDLVEKFAIAELKIYVCGLNPHAGEDGVLGIEEIETITSTLQRLREQYGMQLVGPLPADTIFSENTCNKRMPFSACTMIKSFQC